MEITELKKVFVELLDTNIVLITVKSGFTIEVEDIKEIKTFNLNLMGNKEYALVIDAKYYTSVSSKARKTLSSSSIEKNRKAMSVVIYELSQRVLGNLYIRLSRTKVPTKLFSNKEDAIVWVKKQLNQ